MPNDRAAVAREVLTELEQHFRDDPLQGLGATAATVVKWFRDEHYPAPPAPETVTVDGVTYERRDDICQGGWYAFGTTIWPDEWKGVALTRIASDARGIRERDARIAELEQLLQDQPRLLYDSMWQAIDRMGDAVGTLTGPGSNCHVTATRVCETIETLKSERDAALRALEEKGAGTLPKGASASEESQAAGSLREAPTSPAPIPLGAVVEVEGVEWTRTESGWDGGARWYHDGSTAARALTALYRARHPVATRETVERVRKALLQAFRATRVGEDFTENCTRAALTAAGFTLEEGA